MLTIRRNTELGFSMAVAARRLSLAEFAREHGVIQPENLLEFRFGLSLFEAIH